MADVFFEVFRDDLTDAIAEQLPDGGGHTAQELWDHARMIADCFARDIWHEIGREMPSPANAVEAQ